LCKKRHDSLQFVKAVTPFEDNVLPVVRPLSICTLINADDDKTRLLAQRSENFFVAKTPCPHQLWNLTAIWRGSDADGARCSDRLLTSAASTAHASSNAISNKPPIKLCNFNQLKGRFQLFFHSQSMLRSGIRTEVQLQDKQGHCHSQLRRLAGCIQDKQY